VKELMSDGEGSPRAILETPVSETESETDSSLDSGKEGYLVPWKSMVDVFKFKSVRKLTSIPLLAVSHDISKKGLTKKLARIRSAEEGIDIGAIPAKPSWRNFDYEELAAATKNFSPGMN